MLNGSRLAWADGVVAQGGEGGVHCALAEKQDGLRCPDGDREPRGHGLRQLIFELEFSFEFEQQFEYPRQQFGVNIIGGGGAERFGIGVHQRLLGHGGTEVAGCVR